MQRAREMRLSYDLIVVETIAVATIETIRYPLRTSSIALWSARSGKRMAYGSLRMFYRHLVHADVQVCGRDSVRFKVSGERDAQPP